MRNHLISHFKHYNVYFLYIISIKFSNRRVQFVNLKFFFSCEKASIQSSPTVNFYEVVINQIYVQERAGVDVGCVWAH